MKWLVSIVNGVPNGDHDLFDDNGALFTWVSEMNGGFHIFGVGVNKRVFPTLEAAKTYAEFMVTYYTITGEYPDPSTEI